MGRSQPPLSPNEQTALDHLAQADAETVVREQAVEHLVAAGFVAPAARDLIERLCRKGYLENDEIGLRLTVHD